MKKRMMYIILILLLVISGCGNEKAPDKTAGPSPSATRISPETEEIDMEEMAVSLVSDLAAGEFGKVASDYPYTLQMKIAVGSEEILKDQIWNPLIATYGAFSEITGTLASQQQEYDIISVKTTFEKSKLYINVVFDSNKQIAGLNYVPDPEAVAVETPKGIIESEITFGKSGWKLPGTLTKPEGEGPFPVVILVHGSGPQDRNETTGANAPFRDIAQGLAQKGIATLRYDKRTYAHQQKMLELADHLTVYEEAVEDAALAVEFLSKDSQIDRDGIFVLGHSLGGMLIPRIAELTPDASGYIIMAGSVTAMEDLMVEQIHYICELDGAITDQEEQALKAYKSMRENVKALTPNSDTPPDQIFGVPASYWLDLKDYHPANEAKAIEKPLLILQGERDYQVTMGEFEQWKNALEHKNNVAFKSYEGLNHLMIYGTEKSSPEEYMVPGQVDEQVVKDIASWILGS